MDRLELMLLIFGGCRDREPFGRRPTMAEIERLTITLPTDMAAVVKGAVADGDYASTSEVIRAAVRDWKMKRALQLQELAALKTDIDKGLADVAAGRVKDFDATSVIERGEEAVSRPLVLRLKQENSVVMETRPSLRAERSNPRAACTALVVTQAVLARRFNVSRSTISRLVV